MLLLLLRNEHVDFAHFSTMTGVIFQKLAASFYSVTPLETDSQAPSLEFLKPKERV